MDVIETTDIELAAYAMARGGGLRRVIPGPRVSFHLEGLGLEEVEIDFVHFGPRGVGQERLERLTDLLRSAAAAGRRSS